MPILSILFDVVLVGVVIYLILLIPMPEPIKRIIVIVASILMVLWILQSFGFATNLPHVQLK